MPVAMSNNACSQLEGAIDNVVTNITIGPEGIFFPSLAVGDWFYGTISNDPVNTGQLPEIVKVTISAIDGGTGNYDLTVERGAGLDGALPKAWSDQSAFQLLVTSELLYDLITEGVSVAGATSFILGSKTLTSDYIMDPLIDNGLFFKVSPGPANIDITLDAIPATAAEDVRYVINKRSNTTDGEVVITAAPGQTINGLTSISINQQYGAVILHGRPGDINWDLIILPNYTSIPNDGNVYGIVYGPNWVVVTEEAPIDGRAYVRKDGDWSVGVEEAPNDGQEYVRINESWQVASVAAAGAASPTGMMAPYPGVTAPTGWEFCDGRSLGTTSYPDLFAAIGTTYGSPDATLFNLPDMRGRTIRGLDNLGGSEAGVMPGRNTLGGVAGSAVWTMTSAQMPVHSHSGTAAFDGVHAHNVSPSSHSHTTSGGAGSTINTDGTGGGAVLTKNQGSTSSVTISISPTNTGHTHSLSINNAGSGNSISSASPYMDMNWIIKL